MWSPSRRIHLNSFTIMSPMNGTNAWIFHHDSIHLCFHPILKFKSIFVNQHVHRRTHNKWRIRKFRVSFTYHSSCAWKTMYWQVGKRSCAKWIILTTTVFIYVPHFSMKPRCCWYGSTITKITKRCHHSNEFIQLYSYMTKHTIPNNKLLEN